MARDKVGKNIQIQGSASFIDSVLLEDNITGRLFMFADAMPAGIGFSNTAVGSGFKMIKDSKYIKLRWHTDGLNQYDYSIRENGIIYNDTLNQATTYSVDNEYNLLKNSLYLTQKQYKVRFEGTSLIENKTDIDVKMNIFYKDSLLKVLPTNFLVMKYSDDEGKTWSGINIMSSFKGENERVPLYGQELDCK